MWWSKLERIIPLLSCFLLNHFSFHPGLGYPSLDGSSAEPVTVLVDEDVFIDCIVHDVANYTVIWKYSPSSEEEEVLTAGIVRIHTDNRYSVFHSRNDLWVLSIRKAQLSDSGLYICEVNTDPPQKITQILSVTEDDHHENSTIKTFSDVDHNYTDCCISSGVPFTCQSYCSFQGLITSQQPTSVIQSCLDHLPKITSCLTDGRNHMPCCKKQNVPPICRPVCVGNFSLITVKDHFTCMNYAAPILACIAEGIQTLPPQPKNIFVEPLSPTELHVQWSPPLPKSAHLVDGFYINITQLLSFDGFGIRNIYWDNLDKNSSSNPPSLYGLTMRYTARANESKFLIQELKPYTMYEVLIVAFNKFGESIPTRSIRSLTLPNSSREAPMKLDGHPEPELPDTKSCCEHDGVTLGRCVDVLCDPVKAEEATITDLMICAPWANITFKCLSTDVNHTDCCAQRGVPDTCWSLCSGTVSRVSHKQFQCLEHMGTLSSCVLSHHGLLPSQPDQFMVINVHHDWAIVKWRPPKKMAHTIVIYHLFWRESAKDTVNRYKVELAKKSPYLLDNLKPDTRYEVYVTAVNQYGSSEGSTRVIFITPPLDTDEEVELERKAVYNETTCCLRSRVPNLCLPLCSYHIKVTDVLNLAGTCAGSLPGLIRCGAGGRNHIPCCRQRRVSSECLNLCAGLVDSSPFTVAAMCNEDFGDILQCMEEGAGKLPGMPNQFHAIHVTSNSIHLQWNPAPEDDVKDSNVSYQIRYGIIEADVPLHPLQHNFSINASQSRVKVNNLEPNTRYSFYVVAANMYGISLPSLVLMVNTSKTGEKIHDKEHHSTIGPPHSLEVITVEVDSITFKWLPPLFLPPDRSLSYIVHYKAMNGTEAEFIPGVTERWIQVETFYNTMIITNLTYNTEYGITIQTKTDQNETSPFSEMVLVWTRPVIPASVNLPVIIPAGPIIEGTTITIMCIAQGVPTPTVSIFVDGFLKKRDERRQTVYTMSNVNRNLTSISCYSVNGFGKDTRSSKSFVDVRVRFKPSLKPYVQTAKAYKDEPAKVQCLVTGNPAPEVIWYRDLGSPELKKNPNLDFITVPFPKKPSTWIATLLIRKATGRDNGKYICSGSNIHGQSRGVVYLQVDPKRSPSRNATDCCINQKVVPACMKKACGLTINAEDIIETQECITELNKLMFCASDGSDHRKCCVQRRVEGKCLRWCMGLKVEESTHCMLSSGRDIAACFEEGKVLLPGPPLNVHVEAITKDNQIIIQWNKPEKNPDVVEFYKIFWRSVGHRTLYSNQTKATSYALTDLKKDKMYEIIVKSGNNYGMSVFTDPLVIPNHIQASSTLGNRLLRVFFGTAIAAILLIIGAGLIVYLYRYQYLPRKLKNRSGVSFENPSYLKDAGTVQIHDSPISPGNGSTIPVGTVNGSNNNFETIS